MSKEIGEATIYGTWDDCKGYQFIVLWGEAGSKCTVLMLDGADYGGGVTIGARVPLIDLNKILEETREDTYEQYKAVNELVELYKDET